MPHKSDYAVSAYLPKFSIAGNIYMILLDFISNITFIASLLLRKHHHARRSPGICSALRGAVGTAEHGDRAAYARSHYLDFWGKYRFAPTARRSLPAFQDLGFLLGMDDPSRESPLPSTPCSSFPPGASRARRGEPRSRRPGGAGGSDCRSGGRSSGTADRFRPATPPRRPSPSFFNASGDAIHAPTSSSLVG